MQVPISVKKAQTRIPATAKAKWTFMVFMAGDNNLDAAAVRDIAEMAQAGSTPDVHIIAELDRAGHNPTQRFYITKGGGIKKDVVVTLPETNTGDPAVLSNFLSWGIQNYPAEHYFLVLWNHGNGWWEDERKKKGIAFDDSQGDYLNNAELISVLEAFRMETGKKLDILGMDACLMTMLEMAHELKNDVQFMVGSEIEEPFEGWPYHTILKYLIRYPHVSPGALAGRITKLYVDSYARTTEDVTQSAVDLSKIDLIASRMNDLSKALLEHYDTNAAYGLVSAAWRLTPKFYSNMYLDLYHFAANIKKKSAGDVKAKAAALMTSLAISSKKPIIANNTKGAFGKKMKGLSIYFPPSNVNAAYYELNFCKNNLWAEFLKKYHAQYQ